MSYTTQRCSKGHTHWTINQVKSDECGMACVGILLKEHGINVSLAELRQASQGFEGGYRPGIGDVVRGDPARIQAQHMMAAIMRHDEGQVITQARAGEFGTQCSNLAALLGKYGLKAVASYNHGGAKKAMRQKAKKTQSSIALVRWVQKGQDAGGHFVVIQRANTHLFSHSEYCIMDPIYGLSTQTLPTMPGHPGGNAPQYHPPNSGGAVGYLMGWHVVVI
ncbi:MAG: hypothetical protein KDJ24_09100 [Gammaproteobacteria bacterium]|nr:hypothetical protein [Gammaproteobacteria bacterium]